MESSISLSPTRASDFKACPQLYKFRHVDQLPEPFDPLGFLGSLVHLVLEKLHQLPPEERTEEAARELLSKNGEAAFEADAAHLIHNYFRVENPGRVETHQTEWMVTYETERTLLRGIIDRVEVNGDEWILVDYKTGRSPSETFALGSFFGLRFYALICWRAFGKLPRELRLLHLRDSAVITLRPNEQMLLAVERQMEAIGEAIRRALFTGNWKARPSRLCNWCPHQRICPAMASRSDQRIPVSI